MNFGQWLEQEFHQNPWRFVFTFGPLVLLSAAFVKFLGAIGCRWSYPYYVDEVILANWWTLHHVLAIVLMAAAVAVILAIDGVLTLLRRRKTQVSRSMERMNKLSQAHNRLQAMLPDHTISTKFSRQLEEERAKMAAKLHAKPKKSPETPVEPTGPSYTPPSILPWRPITAERSCVDPVDLGVYTDDGRPMTISLTPAPGQQLNMLVAGMSGYGKTSALNVLIANYAWCSDAIMGGIDVGGGGFHRWRKLFREGWYADESDDVAKILGRIEKEADDRHHIIRQYDEPIWTPSPQTPDVFFFVDEGADLMGIDGAYDILFKIARKGRKVGVHVIYATQRPSADVITPTLRSQLQVRMSLRVMSADDSRVVFGPGAVAAGWSPHEISRSGRGIAVLEIPTADVTTTPGLVQFMGPDAVKEVVAARTGSGAPRRQDDDIVDAEWREVLPELPGRTMTPKEQIAWCRDESYRMLKDGRSDHHKPARCEGCQKGHQFLTMHHYDYNDPSRWSWFCKPCHEAADREKEVAENALWSDEMILKAIELHQGGMTWPQVAELYGVNWKTLASRCDRWLQKRGKKPKPRAQKLVRN